MSHLIGIFGLVCLTAFAGNSQSFSTLNTNADWNTASDLEVMLHAVELTTPMPAENLPKVGTYWSAQHAPGTRNEWPPLPANTIGASAWSLGDDAFLLDDRYFNYNALDQPKTLTFSSGRTMEAMDIPSIPGGGSGGGGGDSDGTNVWDEDMPVTDAEQARAFAARSRTDAVGATAGLNGVIQSSINLTAQFGFGLTELEHSAQWTRPIQTSRPYYLQILNSLNWDYALDKLSVSGRLWA